MRLIYESGDKEYWRRITVESNAVTIHEVMQEVKGLLIAAGFHPDNLKEYIEDE